LFLRGVPQRSQGRRKRSGAWSIVVLALLFLIIAGLTRLPGVHAWDEAVTRAVQTLHQPWLNRLMIGATRLGDAPVIIAVSTAAAALLLLLKMGRAALFTLVTLSALLLNILIKAIFGRPRPAEDIAVILRPTEGLSFPSGHAMGATAVYGFFAYLCWVHLPPKWRAIAAAAFATLAFLIGISRIYVGVHWLSDVLAGFTAGLILLILIVILYNRATVQPRQE
jgi:membrane-associated phospholipid phosphatase